MTVLGHCPSHVGLEKHGICNPGDVFWNLSPQELQEHALQNGEAKQASNGALVCKTGAHTGRAPKDKFFVDEPTSRDHIGWGRVNRAISDANFDRLQ